MPAAENLERISKKMSYLLRHSPAFIDRQGWADIPAIIAEIQKTYPGFNEALLREIVATDAKGRYSLDASGRRIRANQGHSVPVEVDLERREPPEILYHGTATRFLNSIMKQGLTGQSRLYVHLSGDYDTAVKVGARHGKPVVLKVQAGRMRADGFAFFLSANGVWLTERAPAAYLEIM